MLLFQNSNNPVLTLIYAKAQIILVKLGLSQKINGQRVWDNQQTSGKGWISLFKLLLQPFFVHDTRTVKKIIVQEWILLIFMNIVWGKFLWWVKNIW